jgi:hypothetical protein
LTKTNCTNERCLLGRSQRTEFLEQLLNRVAEVFAAIAVAIECRNGDTEYGGNLVVAEINKIGLAFLDGSSLDKAIEDLASMGGNRSAANFWSSGGLGMIYTMRPTWARTPCWWALATLSG